MNKLPRVSYPGRQAWIGLLISGGWFLLLAILFGAVFVPMAVLGSIIIDQHGGAPISPLRNWLIENKDTWFSAGFCGVAFLAAFISARSRWIYRPALSGALACAIAMGVWVSPVWWDMLRRVFDDEVFPWSGWQVFHALTLPCLLPTSAALGGRFGMRRFAAA